MISDTSRRDARWTGHARRHQTTQGTRLFVVMGRIKWQALPMLSQGLFDLEQGRSRIGGDDQLGWLVTDDATQFRGVQVFGQDTGRSQKVLATHAPNGQHVPLRHRRSDALLIRQQQD
jgi:hypothetical protein